MNKKNFSLNGKQLWQKIEKFKYPLLMLLIGLLILSIPIRSSSDSKAQAETEPVAKEDDLSETEARLEEILSQVAGAGRVRVMLTYSSGTKTVFQQDTDEEVSTDTGAEQRKNSSQTVLISAGSAKEEPVTVQTIPPTFLGAVVVSDGAGNATVRLNLVKAVSSLTGLGADKITVIKMKSD